MGRPSILASILVILVALAEASIIRTTVTTTDDQSPHEGEKRCRKETSQVRMDSCRRYLQPEGQFIFLENSDVPQECCEQLKQVNEICRCQAVQQTVQQIPSTKYTGGQLRVIAKRAEKLPKNCALGPSYCQIGGVDYSRY